MTDLEYNTMKQLAHQIGVPRTQLDRKVLREHLDRLDTIRYNYRKAGNTEKAREVTKLIIEINENMLKGEQL